MKIKILLALLATMTITLSTQAAETKTSAAHKAHAATKATVAILEPTDGATVATTFTVKFGAEGVAIVPAGTIQENSGHHHLLIDVEEMPNLHAPLPMTANLVHFGKGQTETEITLAPGTHTLQLMIGNHAHIPGDKPTMSKKITVTVK